jgi:hypothetical protein
MHAREIAAGFVLWRFKASYQLGLQLSRFRSSNELAPLPMIITHEQALNNTPLSPQERRHYIILCMDIMDGCYRGLHYLPQNTPMSEASMDLVLNLWAISDGALSSLRIISWHPK